MNRKRCLFLLAAVFIVLFVNCLLAKIPVTALFNVKDLGLGVGIVTINIIMSLTIFFVRKMFFKSYIYYRPKEFWLISFLVFACGLFIIINSLVHMYYVQLPVIDELYVNMIFQLLLSVILIAVMYEIYNYMYELPVRMALKAMERAGRLIENYRLKEALIEYDRVLGKLDAYARPKIYGWVKQAKGTCYIELSKQEEKRQNLLRAVKEFEAILKFKELYVQHGQVKMDIGNIFFDIAEIDKNADDYKIALNMYTEAKEHFKYRKDIDGYMNALRNAEKTKTILMLKKTS